MEIKLWKRALLGSSHLLGLPLNHRLGTEAPSYFSLMFRLTGAHCNWRLLIVNSSLELVSTLNSHGWTMSPTNSCFHLFVCSPVAKIKIFEENRKKTENEKMARTGSAALKSDFMIMTWFFRARPALCILFNWTFYGLWQVDNSWCRKMEQMMVNKFIYQGSHKRSSAEVIAENIIDPLTIEHLTPRC